MSRDREALVTAQISLVCHHFLGLSAIFRKVGSIVHTTVIVVWLGGGGEVRTRVPVGH